MGGPLIREELSLPQAQGGEPSREGGNMPAQIRRWNVYTEGRKGLFGARDGRRKRTEEEVIETRKDQTDGTPTKAERRLGIL